MHSHTTRYILAATFAISGLLLVAGLGGAWYVHLANQEVSDALDEYLAEEQATISVVLALREVRLDLSTFEDTAHQTHLNAARANLDKVLSNLPASRLEVLTPGSGECRFEELRHEIAILVAASSPDHQLAAARGLIALISELLAIAERHLTDRQHLAREASRHNQLIASRIGIGLLVFGVSGALAGLLAGFGLARRIHRSLVQISIPVQDMAGRLNEVVGPIMVETNTDLSGLDDSLRMLSDKTSDVVRRLQQSLRKSLRREQLAAVGQLAAGLAHELRNPLMSVNLILQTAAERERASLSSRDLAVIQDELTRLERMLQTFLDFARPPRPQLEPVELSYLVETTLEIVQLRATQQDIQLHFPRTSQRLTIDADVSQLRQLLLNLLFNALDALSDGGNVWLDVGTEQLTTPATPMDGLSPSHLAGSQEVELEGKSPYVRIRVADDGPGLSAAVLERVFEPFVSTKDTGIGLGLSICQRIVESHNGRITAANRVAGGAEFTVYLPQAVAAPA